MDDLTEVKLMMEGGLADRLLVRRLSLKEGICRIPTAELVLCTKGDAIRMDELETYVEKAASLEISRTDAATERRTTRWFAGMVTSVEGCGVVAQSRSGEIFEYRMTIQPKLVNLCYSRSGRNFIQTTAMEAVRTILKGFDVQYQGGGLPESANLKQDFFQRHESDYAFLMRILASCGLSYTFRTPDQTGRVAVPVMHVGTGNALPAVSDFLCDGKAVLPSAFSCAALRTDGGYCKMDSWRMRKSIGVDSLEVGFTNRAGADVRGAAGTGDARRMRMDEALFADSKQGEIDRLVEEHLRKMRVPTAGWTGTTQCLEALPGNLLKVNHFYGRNSTEVIEALVFASTLDCTLPILPGESVFGEDDKVSMRIALRCLAGTSAAETVSGAAETVSAAADSVALETAPPGIAGIVGAGGGGGESAALFVKQAVVTDLSGNVSEGSTNAAVKFVQNSGYVFYAKVNPKDEPDKKFEVNFTQPVGGYGQGLFRMPRVGDRILVLGVPTGASAGGSQNAIYYLLGYLPGVAMPFTTSKELERTKEAAAYKTALPEEMMTLRFQIAEKVPDEAALTNRMAIRRDQRANQCSEVAFYNSHTGKKFDKGGNEVDRNCVAKSRDELALDKYKKQYDQLEPDKKKAVDEAYALENSAKVLANFQSSGDMQLSANENMEVTARNLAFKGKGWAGKWDGGKLPDAQVTFDDINRFVVTAKDSITFKVGHNSITIDQTGISIKAPRWTNVTGPADASISLNSFSGVTVAGLNCKINGLLTASIGETMGGKASFCAGSTTISGANVTQRTLSAYDFRKNEFSFGVSACLEAVAYIANLNKDWEKGLRIGQSGFNSFLSLVNNSTQIGKLAYQHKDAKAILNEEERQKADVKSKDVWEAAFDLIQTLIDIALLILENVDATKKWLDTPCSVLSKEDENPLRNRDLLRLAALVCKLGNWFIALHCKSAKALSANPLDFFKDSKVSLEYGKLSAKTGQADLLSETLNSYNVAFNP